jgi:predicted exporter
VAAVAPGTRATLWRALALGWVLVVVAIAIHQVAFWRAAQLDSDVMAMLPAGERAAAADRVLRQLSDGASREIAVLVGAPEWRDARAAAERFAEATAQHAELLEAMPLAQRFDLDGALAFYRPYRQGLLTEAQRELLRTADPDALAARTLARLYQISAGPRLTDWKDDPLGLWADWWLARTEATRVRERDGLASVSGDGMQWVLLTYRTTRPAFSASGASDYGALLDAAGRAATQGGEAGQGNIKVVASGIPLHAEAAASQASFEMNVIGLGSLAAVVLLVWCAFRSVRPIVLVALSLLVGTAAAISVTALVFGRVHLITLVFGASLVGVAEDYGIHYFSSRQGRPAWTPARAMRFVLPGMALALATSVVAYLALGIAPFPGLRQMALFSAVGLIAAFATVVLWYPWLDRGPVRRTRFATRLAASLARWPSIGMNARSFAALGMLGLFIAGGLWQLRVVDDVRQLQSSPAALVEAQRTTGRLLGTPSPAQFIVVRGDTHDAVLAREEAVKAALASTIHGGLLDGVIAISDWIPSQARQSADAALAAPVEAAVRERVARELGGTVTATAAAPGRLALGAWLAQPVSAPLRGLWLDRDGDGYASVMLLRGLRDAAATARVRDVVSATAGAQWVDRVADYSALLERYRTMMSWLLAAGAAAVAMLLYWRHGRAAWRALVPTLLAIAFSVAVLGWLDAPLQLFSVLALALLLGVGVDYGIFLLEHPDDGDAWNAVVLGAASTLLAFGLLALSRTPALHAFGTTMLAGVGMVWVLSPWFRPRARPAPPARADDGARRERGEAGREQHNDE